MKILSVIGTRPEAIKMAPVVRALSQTPGVESRVCSTGQHRSMLDSVLTTFAIKADIDLDVMLPNQSLAGVFARVLTGLDRVLEDWRPDCVLVQGDTATSTAAALAAFFRKVPVGHVEAGLRTGEIFNPWPEEANRRMTGVIADRHYAPTKRAQDALLAEGVPSDRVFVTGNTVIDALVGVREMISRPTPLRADLEARYSWVDPSRRVILVTGHRRESFGQGFRDICEALRLLARRTDVQIIYPVHLNPNVRGPVFETLSSLHRVHLIEPVDYVDFVYLMTKSAVILTDSGGVQEEAPMLRKPVLVMRETSERPEALEQGVARLVGTGAHDIVAHVERLLDDPQAYAAMASGASPYGDGRASGRIVADLVSCFGAAPAPKPVDKTKSHSGRPERLLYATV